MRLVLDDVSFRYDARRPALFEGVSFSWAPGTLGALKGPSGAGKSTLLDILGGLRPPTSGSCLFEDADLSSTDGRWRGECAWVLQSNAVLSQRTTLDNVSIGALARGSSVDEARRAAREALDSFGLGEKQDMPVDLLSGGEKQRVTIARCLISPSRVVLADEPTGNLDAENTLLVAQSLRVAAASGKIVVVATHDADVVARCDTILDLRARSRTT